jgi:hypothetical protein
MIDKYRVRRMEYVIFPRRKYHVAVPHLRKISKCGSIIGVASSDPWTATGILTCILQIFIFAAEKHRQTATEPQP